MSYKKHLLALSCAALYCPMYPALSSTTAAQAPSGQAPSTPAQSGMVVVRDAQTGQLRAPTAAESRALAPQGPTAGIAAQAAPALVTHPGGARQVRLGERGLVYSVVTRGADGKLAEQCVKGAAAAEKAVHTPASAQHKEDRHE